jgi:hypothetical protein
MPHSQTHLSRNSARTPVPALKSFAALGAGLWLLAGCAVTERRPVEPTSCAFLGKDCSKLKPGAEGQLALRYVNPAAHWSRYDKVMIEPVTFWGGQDSQYSPEDQRALLDYFYRSLRTHLGQHFQIVDQAGPGVMKVQLAITDVESATPGLRSVSMIVPQAHMLSNLGYAATDKFPFVGGAQAEGRITDAASGEVLAMAVDRRIGEATSRPVSSGNGATPKTPWMPGRSTPPTGSRTGPRARKSLDPGGSAAFGLRGGPPFHFMGTEHLNSLSTKRFLIL